MLSLNKLPFTNTLVHNDETNLQYPWYNPFISINNSTFIAIIALMDTVEALKHQMKTPFN